MLLKILLSSMFILSLISCGSEQNSSNKVNSEIKILPSESKRTQFKTSKQTLLIEESDAEESLGNDNQPIILAQASINQNNNWEFTESEHYMRLVPTQPTIGGPDKIEVAEFFYYGCIHCMTFEPIINAWKKRYSRKRTFCESASFMESSFKTARKNVLHERSLSKKRKT